VGALYIFGLKHRFLDLENERKVGLVDKALAEATHIASGLSLALWVSYLPNPL
jgi:hypothetical protein